jgi:ECF sigma factor
MRRILVESARRKKVTKHGGDLARQDYAAQQILAPEPREDLLALDEALRELDEKLADEELVYEIELLEQGRAMLAAHKRPVFRDLDL